MTGRDTPAAAAAAAAAEALYYVECYCRSAFIVKRGKPLVFSATGVTTFPGQIMNTNNVQAEEQWNAAAQLRHKGRHRFR